MTESLLKQCQEILGADLYSHELVATKPTVKQQLIQCATIKDVVIVLNRQHKTIHGHELSLPRGRYNYWKFQNECKFTIQTKKGTDAVKENKKKNKRSSLVGDYLRRHKNDAVDVNLSLNNNTSRLPYSKELPNIVKVQLSAPEPNFHY